MAISKSTPYVRYKKDFTSSLHLGTIHIESEYLDRTQKTTIESIHGMTWHNKVVNENKELNLLSDTQLELTDLEKQYWNTGEKRVSVDEIHTLEEVEPNEDGTYTYTVNSMEGEYIEIYDGINNITSTSDGLDGQFEIVYDTTEEDINGNIALDQVAPQYEIADSGVGAIIGAKSTGLTLVNHITESSKEEVVAIEQQEGKHFTIENTVQGNIKSATLKGQTLVNLINGGEVTKNATNNWVVFSADFNADMIKTSTDYTLITYVISNTLSDGSGCNFGVDGGANDGFGLKSIKVPSGKVGVYKIKLTTKNVFSQPPVLRQQIYNDVATGSITFKQVLVEGDYTNVDVPYFEGMQSVKMPVLKTVGKNLFDGKVVKGYINDNGTNSGATDWVRTDYFPVEANTDYYFSVSPPFDNANLRHVYLYDENKKYLDRTNQSNKFRPSVNGFVRCVSQLNGGGTISDDQASRAFFQIAHGTDVSSYEPYKSNILTVNEPVELRGIGDVKDELNVVTGEFTQRIGEVVLDGSDDEKWVLGTTKEKTQVFEFSSNSLEFDCRLPSDSYTNKTISDKFIHSNQTTIDDTEKYAIGNKTGIPTIWVALNKTTASTVIEFETYLKSNPITIQYQLATESIKTVDLTVQNQDGNIIPHIQTQQGATYVSTSSDGLSPVVEMSCSYDTIIKPNTTYTIKLDRPIVSDTMYLQVDLGGTMMMLDANVNAFTIKTPNTLSHSQLRLSGTGNTVKEIIVLEGNRVNDKIEYFEGMKNVENPILVVSNCPYVFGKGEGVTFKKYQSTTLSLNEPIQLRSIGDVHDEINYETGEYIQRIGEIVLDGSENWQESPTMPDGFYKARINISNDFSMGSREVLLISDRFASYPSKAVPTNHGNCILRPDHTTYDIELIISDDDIQTHSLQAFKQYLQDNPTTVQYRLAEPIITKIDTKILDQNNNYKSSQQTYDESTYISVQSDTVVTPTSSVDYEIYSSTGTVTGTSATIENAEAGTPISGVVYGETLLNVIQEPSETEYIITGDAFEEQSGTLENTIEGNIKSAILKGNTLVNLYPNINREPSKFSVDNDITVDDDNWIHVANREGLYQTVTYKDTSLFKPNTTYTVIVEVKNNTLDSTLTLFQDNHNGIIQSSANIEVGFNGTKKILVTTVSDFTDKIKVMQTQKWYDVSGEIDYRIIIIEGNYTNVDIDIPYFEGMQSVNLYPDQKVLQTIGKNLFNKKGLVLRNNNRVRADNGEFVYSSAASGFDNYFDCQFLQGKTIRVSSIATSDGGGEIAFYTIDKTYITGGRLAYSYLVPKNAFYYRFSINVLNTSIDEANIQIEVNSVATLYEPHKSNILTVNEDVTLRSNGDVYDELNLLTGRLTQRIDENNEVLAQAVVKTVDLSIIDQDDKPIENLHTFDTTTHINTYAQGGGLIPFVNIPESISYDTMLKANTQYTIKLNRTNIVNGVPLTVNLGGTELSIEDSADSFTITTPSTLTNNTLSISGANNKVKEVMVIEGDYVDRDLDYFEGFISVENPIMNIYHDIDNINFYNIVKWKTGNEYSELCRLPIDGQTIWYKVSGSMWNYVRYYDKDKNYLGQETNQGMGGSYQLPDNLLKPELKSKAVYFSINKRGNPTNGGYPQLRTKNNAPNNVPPTPLSEICRLTTHPQVTLRSTGDIKDEWDVVGETVTRRIGEIVLDGSENWSFINGGASHGYYWYGNADILNIGSTETALKNIKIYCNHLQFKGYGSALTMSVGQIQTTIARGIVVSVPYNNTVLKEKLRQNPIVIYIEADVPTTESVRITPPNPQTSTASITLPTQLNHVEDTSDFLVWNPYKEHYVRYNYVEDGVVLDNYTWENLTDLNERQFVEFYNKRTYIDQPYHSYVASYDSKGTSKYVLIEPNQDYTVSVRFSELPTCETVKVNLGGAEVEMNVNDPHVHITTPNTLANNLCSISGDGLDGKVTDILVIHCLEHEGFADIDYFEGIDGIGEIVEVDGVPKSKIVMEQTNGNLIDDEFEVWNNGNYIRIPDNNRIILHPNKTYGVIFKRDMVKDIAYTLYVQLFDKNNKQTRIVSGGATKALNNFTFTTKQNEKYCRVYSSNIRGDGSVNKHFDCSLHLIEMSKDYIRPRYYDKEEILLPIQLHRINTVYDNFYYDEMKGYYRIQQSIGHKYFVGADSENWTLIERGQRVLRFRYNNADIQIKSLGEYMTNLLPNGTASSPYESCTFNGTTFIVSFDIERFEIISLEQFKLWLSEHPLHLYYQLMTPIMVDLPQYNKRIEFNTYKDEIYTFFKNCKPTVFTLGVPLDKTYRFYEYEESQGYANRVELTDERMTDEDTLYIDTIHGSGFSNLIENPNNVETLLKPNYQGKAVSHTLTNGKVSSIKVHGFEPNETTIANYNSTLKRYELIVQAQKGQNINTQTLAVPYKLEVYEDGTKDKVYYDEQNKVFRFEGGSVTNPPYNNSYIFNTPLEVFKGIAPRTGLIAEIKVKFNSGTTSARIYYSLDGGATTAYSTLRSMTDEVEYYIGFFNTGGTKLDYATKLSAEAEYINLAPLSSTLPESLIITQIQNISECTFTLDKTYYFDSWIKPLELDVYNGETIITEQSGAIVTINNNGLHKDALTYTDETYTVYWTYVGGEGNVTITLGGTKVEVVGTQGYATLKTAIDGVQDGLIIGGYNLSIKDLMLVKGERIEDLAYFEGSRAVGTAFVDENGETKYKITLVTGSELINDKFENRITFEDNNKHNVVVTKLLGNKPNKK